MHNICGCLIRTAPAHGPAARAGIAATPGCEIHAEDRGRLVITVEDTPDRRAADIIMDLHQIKGVLGVTLTYHHFEALETDAPRATAA
ncbi:nitrate reductase [Rhodobacter capsulatus]|uniref:Chaperone NapD n=1 Tax=Rhodobacter capsulatus TaxID=1061 RepID=A0A4U1JTC3_RHOCA|nr:chaperone NapD [Rhodobacter capsulatus]TKD21393.1 nitrate reductase [Rhodobacter capsulatus]